MQVETQESVTHPLNILADKIIMRDGVDHLRKALVTIARGQPYLDKPLSGRRAQKLAQFVLEELGMEWKKP